MGNDYNANNRDTIEELETVAPGQIILDENGGEIEIIEPDEIPDQEPIIVDVEEIPDQEPNTTDEVSKDAELLKNLHIYSDINNIKQTQVKMREGINGIINNENGMEKLWEKVELMDSLTLDALTYDEIDAMFIEAGVPIDEEGDTIDYGREVSSQKQSKDYNRQEFRKDLLKFVKNMEVADKEYSKAIDEFSVDIAESEAEITEALAEYDGSIDKFITSKVDALMNKVQDDVNDTDKEFITWYKYGLTLEPIIDYVKSYKGKNILGTYLIDKESRKVLERSRRMRKFLNCNTQFEKYAEPVRSRLFPDVDITDQDNKDYVSLYSIIAYISDLNRNKLSEKDFKNISVFLNALSLNLTRMATGKLSEEDTSTLINSLKTIHQTIVD